MKYQLHYGDGEIRLPAAVLSRLDDADADALKVLLVLAAEENPTKEAIAEKAGCDLDAVTDALGFWRGAGILTAASGEKKKKKSAPKAADTAAPAETPTPVVVDSAAPIKPAATTQLPRYNTEELVTLLESRRELSALVDECSRVLGKVLNTHETGLLLGMVDYLNIDGEYLLLLLAHCAKAGKKSVRYAEQMAISLYDEGITTSATLQECLKQKEALAQSESKIRTLFGMSSRALTTKERKLITAWLSTYQFDMDVITLAYEMTVDAIGKSSIPYTNSILERWAVAGLRTLEEIQKAEEARTAPKAPTAPGNSFDTDDFFDAALKRSFGDDYEPAKK